MVLPNVFEGTLFKQFVFYSAVLLLKVVFVQMATTFYRLSKNIYANAEDVKGFAPDKKDLIVVLNDVDVERIRRCHQNDIENVIPFIVLGGLYVFSGPSPFIATTLFRVFTAARILYTVAYLKPLPQPSRTLCFLVGIGVYTFMAVSLLSTFAF